MASEPISGKWAGKPYERLPFELAKACECSAACVARLVEANKQDQAVQKELQVREVPIACSPTDSCPLPRVMPSCTIFPGLTSSPAVGVAQGDAR